MDYLKYLLGLLFIAQVFSLDTTNVSNLTAVNNLTAPMSSITSTTGTTFPRTPQISRATRLDSYLISILTLVPR
jgi:hypothetical protein